MVGIAEFIRLSMGVSLWFKGARAMENILGKAYQVVPNGLLNKSSCFFRAEGANFQVKLTK